MPWVTSMLVSHPRISTDATGPLGIVGWVVSLLRGVFDGIDVGAVVAVINGRLVEVGSWTVGVRLAGTTTGVAVKIEGVLVGGRKGVGGSNGPGWITQPLQADVSSINRIDTRVFFITSPP
jgi:hypothetical protein